MSSVHGVEVIRNGENDLPGMNPHPNPESPFKGGPASIFQGSTRLYEIQTIRSGSEHGFVEKTNIGYEVIPGHEALVSIIDGLYRGVYPNRSKRNPELTTERVLKSLSYPRTILLLASYQREPVGFGIFPRFYIGDEPVLYSSRAILPEHEQEGLGTFFLKRGIELHQIACLRTKKPLLNGVLMTQSAYSVLSLENLRRDGIIEKIQPFEEPYDKEGKRILYGVHALVFVSSAAIEDTGVSRGELIEVGINEAFTTPTEGTRAWNRYLTMVLRPPAGVGMSPQAGDVVYTRFIIPKRHFLG
ncbi:hypothetical protein HY384_01950 [Candidatus Daviesbacteria bacterium]|nr:hypothetical protein [Candidatus Daviesbacteria bacterium]